MYCQSRITGLNNESYEEKEGMRTAKTQKKKKKRRSFSQQSTGLHWLCLLFYINCAQGKKKKWEPACQKSRIEE